MNVVPTVTPARVPLDHIRLRRLTTSTLWRDIQLMQTVGSTHEALLTAAEQGSPEGLVVVAEQQTAGRGRLHRSWISPARAGLAVSVLLRPGVHRATWGWLPLLAGVSLVQTLKSHVAIDTHLKWPNDVLLGTEGKKAGGILAEVADDAVVLGIGLNATTTPEEFPAEMRPRVTSLTMEGAVSVDRTTLLCALLQNLSENYQSWINTHGDAEKSGLRARYLRVCDTLGRTVRITHGGGTRTGKAIGVDTHGQLVLTTETGTFSLSAGDVTHLRRE